MWEHRRLVVVHAFITEVIIDYLDELYKFLSSTKHAFCHLERERQRVEPLLKICKVDKKLYQNEHENYFTETFTFVPHPYPHISI